MKRVAKCLLGILGAFALVLAGAVTFLLVFRPKGNPPSTEVVDRTPERLARGTYLMENLLSCKHCHSPPDTERYGMPVPSGMSPWSGGIVLDRSIEDFPGVVQGPNITSDVETGIGGWTDGEVMRAIREGVKRDGTTIFPSMPYARGLHRMSDDDLRSVIVYLRSLRPTRRATVRTEIDFPVNLLVRLAPEPATGPVRAPDPKDHLAWGRYLVTIADCKGCHTRQEKGDHVESEAFAGGFEFVYATATGRRRVRSANITPHPTTGYFGRATKQEWIGRVRSFASMRQDAPKVPAGANTLMPWVEFSGLTDQDLGAIYDFMKTVTPVDKTVISFPDLSPDASSAGLGLDNEHRGAALTREVAR